LATRRISHQNANHSLRNWLGAITGAALVWGAIELVQWLLQPTTFPLQRVRVEGALNYVSPTEFEERLAPLVTTGFFSVDIAAVRQEAESIAWIASASVQRLWPDGLRLVVKEHEPLARMGHGELLSSRGVRFRSRITPPGLPGFEAPAGLEQALIEHYRELGDGVRPLDIGIDELSVDARRSWRIGLSNGVELMLGRSDVGQRLARFVDFYRGALASRAADLVRVDLRYPNGFAVRFRPDEEDATDRSERG
jgi:cell division protein FtsQ